MILTLVLALATFTGGCVEESIPTPTPITPPEPARVDFPIDTYYIVEKYICDDSICSSITYETDNPNEDLSSKGIYSTLSNCQKSCSSLTRGEDSVDY